jgi:purine nucleoside phosphorylase
MLTLLSPSSQSQLLTVGTERSNKILVVNLRRICEMDGECGTHEREEKCMQGPCGETPTERDHLEELGVDGCTVLKWV